MWKGDSRGRWEGDTLVVDTLLYEYTIDDPVSFETTWAAAVPMTETEGPMFEYACHEGNYAMFNLLAGARAREAAKETNERQ